MLCFFQQKSAGGINLVFLKVKVQVKHTALKVIAETGLTAAIPLTVHNLCLTISSLLYAEGYVLIGSAGMEPNHTPIWISFIRLDSERRLLRLVHEIGVEDVEAVSLNHLRRGILQIVMCLVVLIPIISTLHLVEEDRLLWCILLLPGEHLVGQHYALLKLLLALQQLTTRRRMPTPHLVPA